MAAPSVKSPFLPYLLKPGQIITAEWTIPAGWTLAPGFEVNHELDCRGVIVMPEREESAKLCGRAYSQVCQQIERSQPETMILDVQVSGAKLATPGVPVEFRSEPQERTLLICGLATNINGCQIRIRDQATQWEFCVVGQQTLGAIDDGANVPYQGPGFDGVPIYFVAQNSELNARDSYHMLAVPHLLESNSSLVFRLTSGLRPNSSVNAFQQTFNTDSIWGGNPGPPDGIISLLCRTV